MYGYGNGMGAFGGILMMVSMVLFWGLIIVGVVLLVRYLGRSTPSRGGTAEVRPNAERLLAERFARGEIDEQEYQSRLAVLHGGHG